MSLNFISVFSNNYKKADNQPDFKDNIKNENQVEFECPHCKQTSIVDVSVAIWKKVSKAGNDYLSVKISKKYVRPEQGDMPPPVSNRPSDNIPW
jgi:uncharacterized protein (DUF736 family)